MRHRRIQLAAAVAVVSIVSVVATTALAGGGQNVRAKLIGFEEVPSVSTVASGKFSARIDRSAQMIEYELSFEDLEANSLFAHIHLGQRTANGGVSVFLCGGGDKPACPATSGTVEGTIDPTDVIGPTGQGIAPGEFEELVRAIRAGVTYANVHSAKFPGGEIRGQITGGGDDEDDDD
jgi:hypothetical protein